MPNLRNGSKGDSNPGSLDCESGILPLSYRAPHVLVQALLDSDKFGGTSHFFMMTHSDRELRFTESNALVKSTKAM